MPAEPIRALLRLLEEERALLLAGDLAGLSRLLPRKEDLLGRLAARGAPGEELVALSGALARNRTLLGAALRGLREGRGLGAGSGAGSGAEAPGGGLVTYDRGGARREAAPPPRRVERRA